MPLGGAQDPAFRGTSRATRWLGSALVLAVLGPMFAVGGTVVAHLWPPLSGSDGVLFCASWAAVVIGTVATYRMRLTPSWKRTLLLCGPVALSLYPVTHDVVSSVFGVAIPLLFQRFNDGGAENTGL